ncbi:hepatitis A virus cellular receptor 2 homolog isoform X2 [Pyxicephalus adspersus]
MCWGRGECILSGCNNVIIHTDGSRVTWRKSDRYQLLGNITQGNVSLTITNVTQEDGGKYCCRVNIPGLFNDRKEEINVQIKQKRYEDPRSVTEQVTTRRGEVISTGDSTLSIATTYPANNTYRDVRTQENGNNQSDYVSPVCAVISVVVCTLLMTLVLYKWKLYKALKTKADSQTSAINIDVLGSVENQATDNIYT